MPQIADNPTNMPSRDAWNFLGHVVRDRREFMGVSQEGLADLGGPRKSTVSKIERGAQAGYPSRTQQQLETALGWDRGAVRSILSQADSDAFAAQSESIATDYVEMDIPNRTALDGDLRSVSDASLLAEVARRLERTRKTGGTDDVDHSAKKIIHEVSGDLLD